MNRTARRENKRKRWTEHRGVGIQWRLMLYLAVFGVFILTVIWIFQVGLLGRIYSSIKSRELTKTEQALVETLGDEDGLAEVADDCAARYSICIQVWRVVGNHAMTVASSHVTSDCFMHHVSDNFLWMRYMDALSSGNHLRLEWNHRQEDMTDKESQGAPEKLLYVKAISDGAEEQYAIFLEVEVTPVRSTVSTLRAQFSWITLAILGGSLLLAYLMSRYISRPLSRMTESARALANKQYDTCFVGNGYRETRELAQTLNYAAQELSKTDQLQRELVANISHDLRTPLTMIKGYAEVIRDLPDENTAENVQVIVDEVTRLSELVDDLLDLSRLQSGTREPSIEVLDLTATVRDIMKRYDTLISHEGYTVTFHATEQCLVRADRAMIMQVVYNLINNAINYCGEDKQVIVIQEREGTRVRIRVQDHGAGIAPEQIPLVWDRYYKVDRTHRRATIGTGLGLSIVKGILELHSATYGVESTPGRGSDFWFELEMQSAQEKQTDVEEDDITE